MSKPSRIKTTTHYEGDRWLDGCREFGPVEINGSPLPEPCLYAEMRIVHKATNTVKHIFKSTNPPGSGRIEIVDPVNYKFTIPLTEEELPLTAGTHEWSFSTYRTADKSDLPLTIWIGTLKITPKV